MPDFLSRPWPWYVTGPLIGITATLLLIAGNKQFGISSNLRHVCAALTPRPSDYFRYEWRRTGGWNLAFALGILIGGLLAGVVFADPEPIAISARTRTDLAALGIHDFTGLVPRELFGWDALLSARGMVLVVLGGFLVGFGTAYAGGCTSGHGITGLADLQLPSLIAVAGFFVGGILTTYLVLPLVL